VNFYKHHLGDYDGATAHLTWEEDMAYTRLLRVYYRRESPIHKDEAYRLIRATTKSQKKAVDSVLREFFVLGDDGYWGNSRADEEIHNYHKQCDHNRRVGDLGGRPKKTTVVSENNHSGSIRVPENNPNQIPEPERTKTPLPPSGAFQRFWEAWPKGERKQARGKCEAMWKRKGLDAHADAIFAHIDALKTTAGWLTGYVPAPLVYLNQERWDGAEHSLPDEPRYVGP
jgi:uncharacterized protein YdaU (DUF1376 family)